ncbi:MAG: glycosyltransferase family 39 protein [bacterium]|nr:glycosyltransferase family 39 protein [bacterium]
MILLILTVFLRVFLLPTYPPGLWYDEAINGLDALTIYSGKAYPIFFDSYGHPREPLFLYFIAVLYSIFGVSAFTLRVAAAIIGSITVIVFYYFIRYLFTNRIAFIASFLLATAKWHLIFSRLSFRTILTPLLLILVCYCLFRAFNERKRIWYILTGIFLGIGMYTYLAFRLAPLFILIIIMYAYVQEKNTIVPRKSNIAIIFLVWFLVFLPLLIDYIVHPFHFFGRTDEVTVFQNGFGEGIKHIVANALKVAMMFSIPGKGDPEPKHNFPGEPALPFFLSIFLVIGTIVAVKKIQDTRYFTLLVWFILFLTPSVFSMGAPNTLRTTGALPALYALIALGFDWVYTFGLHKLLSQTHRVLNIIAVIILLYCGSVGVYQYFRWAKSDRTWLAFNTAEVELGHQIKLWSSDSKSAIYLPKVVAEHPTVIFSAYPFDYFYYETLDPLPNTIYIIIEPSIFVQLQTQFPNGNIIREFKLINGQTWAIAYKT